MRVKRRALRCWGCGRDWSVEDAVEESWACFLRRSVSSEEERCGSLELGGRRRMSSWEVVEDGGVVKVIGDGIAGAGGLGVEKSEDVKAELEDRKMRLVLAISGMQSW
jgi:hypothetical protein